MHICGVILAGGKSRRMGRNKSLLKIQGKTTIEHITSEIKRCSDEVIIIANEKDTYDFLPYPKFSDRFINKGPLAGLESALYHVDADIFIIAACDMPFIEHEVYEYMLEQLGNDDAVVPVYNDRPHPLAGIYKRTVLSEITRQLEMNNLRVRSFFEDINVKFLSSFGGISEEVVTKHFFNMNHPEQYEQAKVL